MLQNTRCSLSRKKKNNPKINHMNFEEFYNELGKLFYTVAASDGKVAREEKEKLTEIVNTTWKPLEDSRDPFGTDKAEFISFAFDFADEFGLEDYLEEFKVYVKTQGKELTDEIRKNILGTCIKIAEAYKGKNTQENKTINRISEILFPINHIQY
jgi:uncharacterized tellurite resistance protein B-like protein